MSAQTGVYWFESTLGEEACDVSWRGEVLGSVFRLPRRTAGDVAPWACTFAVGRYVVDDFGSLVQVSQ